MEATLSRTPPLSGPVQVGLIASLLVAAAGAWAETGDRMDLPGLTVPGSSDAAPAMEEMGME
jgi:alpha-beta hydrolase superfamily lysophospholipase